MRLCLSLSLVVAGCTAVLLDKDSDAYAAIYSGSDLSAQWGATRSVLAAVTDGMVEGGAGSSAGWTTVSLAHQRGHELAGADGTRSAGFKPLLFIKRFSGLGAAHVMDTYHYPVLLNWRVNTALCVFDAPAFMFALLLPRPAGSGLAGDMLRPLGAECTASSFNLPHAQRSGVVQMLTKVQ